MRRVSNFVRVRSTTGQVGMSALQGSPSGSGHRPVASASEACKSLPVHSALIQEMKFRFFCSMTHFLSELEL